MKKYINLILSLLLTQYVTFLEGKTWRIYKPHGYSRAEKIHPIPLQYYPDIESGHEMIWSPQLSPSYPLVSKVKVRTDQTRDISSLEDDHEYNDYYYDSDEDYVYEPTPKRKKTKFEKIEKIKEKIYGKFLNKYLHIKEKHPPEPPKWATAMYGHDSPGIDLPPWQNVLRKFEK